MFLRDDVFFVIGPAVYNAETTAALAQITYPTPELSPLQCHDPPTATIHPIHYIHDLIIHNVSPTNSEGHR